MHKNGEPCLCLNCRLARAEEKISSIEELLLRIATSEGVGKDGHAQIAQPKNEAKPALRIRFHEPDIVTLTNDVFLVLWFG
ncbi:MAG: hypothetical protein HZB92_03355 [Euryarchaeota archaeon]|nr:hypothetical protein [Euryarchaeota archaeon]